MQPLLYNRYLLSPLYLGKYSSYRDESYLAQNERPGKHYRLALPMPAKSNSLSSLVSSRNLTRDPPKSSQASISYRGYRTKKYNVAISNNWATAEMLSSPAQSIQIITVQQNQLFFSSAYTTNWYLEPHTCIHNMTILQDNLTPVGK